MIRTMVKIDEQKCNGCGLCINACHEGAIDLVNGVAKLIRDDYCDGLGNCLPACPTGAISFEDREAAPFDEEAVKRHLEAQKSASEEQSPIHHSGCPGSKTQLLQSQNLGTCPGSAPQSMVSKKPVQNSITDENPPSQLMQWPVQIKLIPVNAPYFNNAKLLIAADCAAYAYNQFHNRFMQNKITIIGCPKLDDGNYTEKLTEILRLNEIKSVTIVRMEVPCCGGLEQSAKEALKNCGKMIPWQVQVISTNGRLLED